MLYVLIHIHQHKYIHAHMHTYIPTYIHTYVCTYLHTCIHTYIHTYMHTYIHTYMHTYIHTYIHAYIHACIHAYICIYITPCVIYTGYSFLAASYNLLYQCIMPNCKLIIANLRKHCDLSDETEKHILESSHARIRCQRLLNFMLDVLNADRDYMKFCYLLFLSTVVTDLPCQMISSEDCNTVNLKLYTMCDQ